MTGLSAEQEAQLALWHSQFHGGGADDCSTDITSPCYIVWLRDALAKAEQRLKRRQRLDKHTRYEKNRQSNRLRARAEEAERTIVRVEALCDDARRSAGGPYVAQVDVLSIERALHPEGGEQHG